mgnify:CR=1 FL=1
MSRIGKLPIRIPMNVDVTNDNSILKVKGTFGTLERGIPEIIGIEQTDGNLIINLKNETRANKALHGLYRTLINNMLIGVSEQFLITLTLQGVGYRASVQGKSLVLALGFSHPVNIDIPDGVSVEVGVVIGVEVIVLVEVSIGMLVGASVSTKPSILYMIL